jgi:hypothetical protein
MDNTNSSYFIINFVNGLVDMRNPTEIQYMFDTFIKNQCNASMPSYSIIIPIDFSASMSINYLDSTGSLVAYEDTVIALNVSISMGKV